MPRVALFVLVALLTVIRGEPANEEAEFLEWAPGTHLFLEQRQANPPIRLPTAVPPRDLIRPSLVGAPQTEIRAVQSFRTASATVADEQVFLRLPSW